MQLVQASKCLDHRVLCSLFRIGMVTENRVRGNVNRSLIRAHQIMKEPTLAFQNTRYELRLGELRRRNGIGQQEAGLASSTRCTTSQNVTGTRRLAHSRESYFFCRRSAYPD